MANKKAIYECIYNLNKCDCKLHFKRSKWWFALCKKKKMVCSTL